MPRARKDRTPIPETVAADLLFAADHTCCICRDASREVQIHHIDEDPRNHDLSNLAPVCLHDHNRTQVRGGFGRSLSAAEVRRYRDDWLARVAARRAKADDLKAVAMAKLVDPPPSQPHDEFVKPPLAFLFAVPAVRRTAIERVKAGWAGSTREMRDASRQYVEALQAVLVALASYLPASEPESHNPRKRYSRWIDDRIAYHWKLLEPAGPGTGGTIVSVEAWAAVVADVENHVVELVHKLAQWDSNLDFTRWRREWDYAAEAARQDVRDAENWQHYYAVEYVGPVWIRLDSRLENRGASHAVRLQWGPWFCEQTVTFAEPTACLVTNKGPDQFPVAIFVTVRPAAHVTFGTGSAPCVRVVDMNHAWCRVSEGTGS